MYCFDLYNIIFILNIIFESRKETLFVPAAACAPKQLAQYPTMFSFIPENCDENSTIPGAVWSLTSNNELLSQTTAILREFKTIYGITKSKLLSLNPSILLSYLECIPRHELLQNIRANNYPNINLDCQNMIMDILTHL